MDEGELKSIVKALHEKQQAIEGALAQERAKFEAEVKPLHEEYEACGRRMDELLGQSRSWIVGHYDASGLPIFDNH